MPGRAFTHPLLLPYTCGARQHAVSIHSSSCRQLSCLSPAPALPFPAGLRGRSSVRLVEVATGTVISKRALAQQWFGEGLTRFGNQLYQVGGREDGGKGRAGGHLATVALLPLCC